MKIIARCGWLFYLSIVLFSCSKTDVQDHSGLIVKKEQFEQYLVGIKYLEMAMDMPVQEKVVYYNKLVALTGVTSSSALHYSSRYTDHPEKWEKVIKELITMIDEPVSNREE